MMKILKGTPVSSGYGMGPVKILISNPDPGAPVEDGLSCEERIARLMAAQKTVRTELEELAVEAEAKVGPDEAEIFRAHIMILEDPDFNAQVLAAIRGGKTVAASVQEVAEKYAQLLAASANEYFQARAQDVRDVANHLRNALAGVKKTSFELTEPAIIVSKYLTPAETIKLDRAKVIGFATVEGSPTSHAAILARSYGVPGLVGLPPTALAALADGDRAIIDGDRGELILHPTPELLQKAEERLHRLAEEEKNWSIFKQKPGRTADGLSITTACNIGDPTELEEALEYGPEGVGLFRTEFLFMGRTQPPTEVEQYTAYTRVAKLAHPHPVTIRALDIGGDKPLPYWQLAPEPNPFLGERGIRFCLARPEFFKTQLRAVLRAAAFGNLKLMIPMVSTVEEVVNTRRLLAECAAELATAGVPYGEVELGIMMELPAAVLLTAELARFCSFFSIGTNDLTQYTLGVDRTNPKTASLADYFHPAVLRLIKLIIDEGGKAGVRVGMCGEMAGDPTALPLLVGLGLKELSMAPVVLPRARAMLATLNTEECTKLAVQALACSSAQEVRTLLQAVQA